MSVDSGVDLIATIADNRDLLLTIESDGPVTSRELDAELECSRATINRRLSDLRTEDLVTVRKNRYTLTEFGRLAVTQATDAFRRLGAIRSLATTDLLEHLRTAPLEFDFAWLVDATVLEATSDDPYRIYDRYLELWDGADRLSTVRKVGPVPPAIVEGIKSKLQTDFDAESVWSKEAAEFYADAYPELAEIRQENSAVRMFVTEKRVPLEFTVFDRCLVLVTYDGETGHPAAIVEAGASGAIDWGQQVYDWYRDGAIPVDEVLLE